MKFLNALLIAAVILAGLFPQVRAEQSPEVKQLVDKGVAAAKQEHWDEAINCFNEARSRSPLDPSLVFNLALACDRSRGREIAAIKCYLAYVALRPEAQNAGQVKKRTAELEGKVEADARMLIQKSLELTGQMGDKKFASHSTVCTAQLALGDIDAALKTADTDPDDNYLSKMGSYGDVARALAKAGRDPEACQLKDRLVREAPDSDKQAVSDKILGKIVMGKSDRGDFTGALQDTLGIKEDQRFYSYDWISMQQTFAGDLPGALKSAFLVSYPPFRAYSLLRVATKQAEGGDKAGALKTIAFAEEALSQIPAGDYSLANVNGEMAGAYAATDKIPEAIKAMERIRKEEQFDYSRGLAEACICAGQARLGAVEDAKKRAAGMKHAPSRNSAFLRITEAQVKAKDFAGAQRTIALIEDESTRLSSQAILALAQGRIAEAEGLGHQAYIVSGYLKPMESLAETLEKLKAEKPEYVASKLALDAYSRILFLNNQRISTEIWEKKKRESLSKK
jgi:tetratricopeptide (TPR) repeat protein